jgi:hypothetical protein
MRSSPRKKLMKEDFPDVGAAQDGDPDARRRRFGFHLRQVAGQGLQ